MELAKFVESLILARFDSFPSGHIRMDPSVHPEIPTNIGEVRQLGIMGGIRFYADPGVPEGQVRFIDANGKIITLLPEEKEVEPKAPTKKPGKKKVQRKRKARSVRTRASKAD